MNENLKYHCRFWHLFCVLERLYACVCSRACMFMNLCIFCACMFHILRVYTSLVSMCVSVRFVIYVYYFFLLSCLSYAFHKINLKSTFKYRLNKFRRVNYSDRFSGAFDAVFS